MRQIRLPAGSRTNYVKRIGATIVLFVVATALLSWFCIGYLNRLNDTLREETEGYLTEVSLHLSDLLSEKLHSSLEEISAFSDRVLYEQMFADNQEDTRALLLKKRFELGCSSLMIAGADGVGINHTGARVDIGDKDYFQQALSGERVISGIEVSPVDQAGSLLYSVPVIDREGRVCGVVCAGNPAESLAEDLSLFSFDGAGYSFIMDRSGTPVVRGKYPYSTQINFDNCFTYMGDNRLDPGYSADRIRQDCSQGKSGTFSYTDDDGNHKYVNYTPMNVNDWYSLTVVPYDVILQKSDLLISTTAIVCIGLAGAFILLLIIILILVHRGRLSLIKLAYTDPVTGGRNENGLARDYISRMEEHPENKHYMLVYSNIEKFKLINDRYGFESGNELLRYVFDMYQAQLLPGELLGRISADNFNMLLEYSSEEQAAARLAQLEDRINRGHQLGRNYHLAFSYGIFVLSDWDTPFEVAQDRANMARENRSTGKHGKNLRFYDESYREVLLRDQELENRMEIALKREEFIVYLQPKYELIHQKVHGAEALVRWNSPEEGMLPPSEFIPLFERNGFIVQLDLYVFEQVCRYLRQWLDKGYETVPISVNLSRVQIGIPNFFDRYLEIQKKYDVPCTLIEFELTESMVFEDVDHLISVIRSIRSYGFSCSLDDFGSGYSSLNLLKDIPVDVLKLDRAFFRHAENLDRTKAVIENVIELAKKLRMQTVSEGVENEEQVIFLQQIGCDMVQGYVYAKPMPAQEFECLLAPSD